VVTLVILPVEVDVFPKLSNAVNGAFLTARVAGVDRSMISKVSLEVVQISIECLESTAACWTAAGKTLNADRLLFAEIDPVVEKRNKKSVRLRVTLFDVKKGETIGTTDHTYPNEDKAVTESRALVKEAISAAAAPVAVKDAPP
jgi:hypothetical protein